MSCRRLALVLAIPIGSLPAAASASEKPAEYRGADAGCLIYSVGTRSIGMRFKFRYARADGASPNGGGRWAGTIEPRVGGAILLKIRNPDFTGEESGHVIVRCLPPGRYAVGGFEFSGSIPGVGSTQWSPARPIVMPFTIRSGEATYIGTFIRAPSLGTPLQPVLGAAGYFLVADRRKRDLPIARARLPSGMAVTNEVTDVSTFGLAALRDAAP